MVALVRDAVFAWLGPVVRMLSAGPPWEAGDPKALHVCLTASELAEVEVDCHVLLRVRAQDITWLNLHRPLIADRRLRLILWADAETADRLQREAVDFSSWIARVVRAPPKSLTDSVVSELGAALSSEAEIAWRGPDLDEALRLTGWSSSWGSCSATNDHRGLVEQLAEFELPIVSDVHSDHDAWRVRLALAHAGRSKRWIALEPRVEIAGLVEIDARRADWDEAAAALTTAGWRDAALLAAWLELTPARIEDACERVGQALDRDPHGRPTEATNETLASLVTELRELGETTPSTALIESLAVRGFDDIALELAVTRLRRGETLDDAVEMRINLGDLYRALGQTSLAREHYEEVLSRLDELATLEPDNVGLRGDLAATHAAIGELDQTHGDFEAAHTHFEAARVIFEALAASDPDRADLRHRFSALMISRGDLALELGQIKAANDDFERALTIYRELVSRDPDDPEFRRGLSVSLQRMGSLHLRLGQQDEARRCYEESLAIARDLAEADPLRIAPQRNLAISLTQVGDLHRTWGEVSEAKQVYDEALTIMRALVERAPGNRELSRALASFLKRTSALHLALGDKQAARRDLERARTIFVELVEREPDRLDIQRALSGCLGMLGHIELLLGDVGRATELYQEVLALSTTLASRAPEQLELRRGVSYAHDMLGTIALAQGDIAGAEQSFEQSLAIHRALVAHEPGNPTFERCVATSLERIAKLDPSRAEASLTEAVDIRRTVHARSPSDVVVSRELAGALVQLGRARDDETLLHEASHLLENLRAHGKLEHEYVEFAEQLAVELARRAQHSS